ncbi:MAG: hypothetical protein AAF602_09755 [Myxococcota bacterium]
MRVPNLGRALSVLALTASLAACADEPDGPEPAEQTDAPDEASGDDLLQSAGALEFGDDNVLFVGDREAGLVHAFDFPEGTFDDQAGYILGRAITFEGRDLVQDIDVELASILGIEPSEVLINDLTLHEPTKQLVLSVHRGTGPDAEPLLFKVDRGSLERLDLTVADHASIDVGTVSSDAELEFGQRIRSFAITDIDYFEGEIFVAGVSGDDFSSTIRRAAYPFDGTVSFTFTEIWHAVHAQFETRSPIMAQDIQVIDGEPYLVGVYACTPLVRFALSDLVDGAQVRGDMIAELGFGNTPVDIIAYDEPFLGQEAFLVTHTHRSATRFLVGDVGSAVPLPYEPPNLFDQAGVPLFDIPLIGPKQLVTIDETWAAAIEVDPLHPGTLQLRTLALPFFFDRSDHVVEMNFPGAPDPFGYRDAPPKGY